MSDTGQIFLQIFQNGAFAKLYFSSNEETMKAFSAAYANEFEAGVTYEWDSEWSEGTLTRRFSRPEFFQNAGAFFKEELRRYLQLKSLTLSLERRP